MTPVRRNERGLFGMSLYLTPSGLARKYAPGIFVVILNKRISTKLEPKMAPALGNCSCNALLHHIHVVIWVVSKQKPLVVARQLLGSGLLLRSNTYIPIGVLRCPNQRHPCRDRHLFRAAKLRSSRLNWCLFSHNSAHLISVNRP